jgi:hypothetical protein
MYVHKRISQTQQAKGPPPLKIIEAIVEGDKTLDCSKEHYLWPPSLLMAFTRASFLHRPSPNPIIRTPFANGAKAAIHFARGDELQEKHMHKISLHTQKPYTLMQYGYLNLIPMQNTAKNLQNARLT